MIQYKLLTPGPLTTTESVKKVMMEDHCTWDDDYKQITQKIRKNLLKLAHVSEEDYTVVLMQGSGSFGVESVLTSVVGEEDKLLIVANGAYGERMTDIADHAKLSYAVYRVDYDQVPSAQKVEEILKGDPAITHVAMVHSETTSGILNDIASVSKVVKAAGKTMIVDAMSSFAGVDIQVEELGIDFLISSANKCIQGVPGFGFIIARKSELAHCKGVSRSLSLDIYDQWETMEKGHGKWRFTSPTHVVRAFKQAMDELEAEGGVQARHERYCRNHEVLVAGMRSLGFKTLLDDTIQSPIITSFLYPDAAFDFKEFYKQLKTKGFVIYPGKISQADTFRIGNIGDVFPEDFSRLIDAIKSTIKA